MIALLGLYLVTQLQEDQIFDHLQRQAIHDALYIANLSESDLKTDLPAVPANPYIASLHTQPILSIAGLGRSKQPDESDNSIGRLRRDFLSEEFTKKVEKAREIAFPDEIPQSVRMPLRALINATLNATEDVRAATSALSPAEKRQLIEGLPSHAVHSSLLQLDFVKEEPASWPLLRGLLEKVDMARIRNAAETLMGHVEKSIPLLNSLAPSSFQSKVRFAVEGVPIVIAGFADDFHEDRDTGLTIDFGGNDRYSGRHGAGVGYASVLIDLDGSDTYTVPDLSIGAGLLGIGMAWDIGGEDVVRGKSVCLGSGIAGVGSFLARGRLNSRGEYMPDDDDLYECTSMGQGFGLYGLGILSDRGGDDVYRAKYLSQGAALSEGIGVLDEEIGNDRYFSDGLAPSLESDSVLRSRSQGFAASIEFVANEPGGIGQLTDRKGQDVYVSGTEAQGCGLDASLGLILDGADDDTFRIAGYGQGYGARSGIGVLLDPEGSDQYICSQSAAQGFAVEGGIGYFLDRKGADLYTVGSGSPGFATYGGLGLFLDLDGFDRYSATAQRQETSLEAHGTGLFLDLGGSNQISGNAVGPISGTAGAFSVFAMLESRRETDSVSPPPLNPAAAPITPEEVESTLAEASGIADYATRAMRFQARADLAAFPKGILVWLRELKRPLHIAEARALGEAFRNAPQDSQDELIRICSASDFRLANNSLQVLAESKSKQSSLFIPRALQNDGTAAAAARAALTLDAREAVSDLMIRCASRNSNIRREASIALSRLGGPEAVPTAQVLLSSDDPVVRKAAVELIGRVGVSNIEPYKVIVSSASEPGARSAMQALGAISRADALEFLATKLTDTRAGIRIEALNALAGRCPRASRAAFEARKEDSDSRVRTVASAVDSGR